MVWVNEYQTWLTESQSLQNAQMVVNFLNGKDWSKESIAALIGNMRHESSVNPNMYEYGYSWGADRGFGLVQWTPRSKFWNWGLGKGYTETQLRSGDSQLARIDYEVDNNIQYIPNGHSARYGYATKYNFSFADFRRNTQGLNVNQLTEAFMWNYEGPAYSAGLNSLSERQAFANRAFNELDWSGTGTGGGGGGETPTEPSEPSIDLKGIVDGFNEQIQKALKEFTDYLGKVLTVDLYDSGSGQQFQNNFIIVKRQLDNTLKVKPSGKLKDVIANIGDSFKLDYIDIPDNGGGNENPSDSKVVFPVDYSIDGINFWKRSNWSVGTLQREMTYGDRGDFHSGYDIGSQGKKVPIYATQDGTVEWSGFKSGGIGNCVYIKHDDGVYWSNYMHLDSMRVNVGDKVKAGQQIGIMGNSGGDYAIHLHFELSPDGNFHSGGNTIDPEGYLKITDDNKTGLPNPVG